MTVYITRCPACQQAFKITENILQAKTVRFAVAFAKTYLMPENISISLLIWKEV